MVKPPSFDSKGMKKGAWSKEEDEKLRAYVTRYGHWNWRLLPKYAGLARCGKSCRLRWVNYLKPGVRKGNFTKEEEELIVKLQRQLGNKWSTIATSFPGRTDSEIKNYWYRRIEKRSNKRKPESKPKPDCNNIQEEDKFNEISFINKNYSNTSQTESCTSHSSPVNKSQDSAQSIENNSSFDSMKETQPEFWTGSPSFCQNEYSQHLSEEEFFYKSTSDSSFLRGVLEWIEDDDQAMISSSSSSSSSSSVKPVQEDFWTEPFVPDAFINSSQSEENYFDPLFQYFDHWADTGFDAFEHNSENLWNL